jgi:hypothetical protein
MIILSLSLHSKKLSKIKFQFLYLSNPFSFPFLFIYLFIFAITKVALFELTFYFNYSKVAFYG